MPLLAALWLALLGALAAAPTARSLGPAAAAVAAWSATPADRPAAADEAARAGRPAREALRAARPVTAATAARAGSASGNGPVPVALASAPRLSGEAAFAADVRARSRAASHAVAARGGVLPYFPTAPPLQG